MTDLKAIAEFMRKEEEIDFAENQLANLINERRNAWRKIWENQKHNQWEYGTVYIEYGGILYKVTTYDSPDQLPSIVELDELHKIKL